MDENSLKTILDTEIPLGTKAILYLCLYRYNPPEIQVIGERLYENQSDGLNAYANIPNPASQLVMADNFTELIKKLIVLHNNMKDRQWLIELGECL